MQLTTGPVVNCLKMKLSHFCSINLYFDIGIGEVVGMKYTCFGDDLLSLCILYAYPRC